MTKKFSDSEYERLIRLFPFPRETREVLGAEARANLMINNYPTVARSWLREQNLLDEQVGKT